MFSLSHSSTPSCPKDAVPAVTAGLCSNGGDSLSNVAPQSSQAG